jgi:hypothetical protein
MTYRYPGGVVRKTAANTSITGASGVWDLGSQAQAVKTNTWPISGLANPISGSLRFRASATAYLTRTGSTATNAKLATYSFWFKRGALTTGQWLFTGGTTVSLIGFNGSSDSLSVLGSDTSGEGNITSAVFRDSSAWYHVVIAIDTAQATTADRAKIYVNGVQQAVTVSNGGIGSNSNWGFNTAGSLAIGRYSPVPGSYTDGYMSEVYFVDGQALTPSSFGQTSAITGVWEPIKYTGTYGTNGFYLSLSDTSSIGKDFSGNGNNWTPNNISTASGSTFDLMRDVPTQYTPQGVTDVGGTVRGNYCVLNPIFNVNGTNVTYSNGGLTFSHPSNSGNAQLMAVRGTIALPAGKFYWEYTVGATVNDQVGIGNDVAFGGSPDGTAGARYINSGVFQSNYTVPSNGASYTTGDIIGVAYDQPNGTLAFYKNNSLQGTITAISTTEVFFPSRSPNSSGTGGAGSFNFGQQPFAYTPPSGFKSLCTTNLPTPIIGATVATAANKYFDATLITGTAATQVITNAGGFQPDFVWLKSRTNANNPTIYDAIRGVNTILYPALTNAEQVGTAQLTAFNSNGFTLGASENANDSNGEASVGWQWNAGGSTVTNTAGSISSQVRANPTAGFSIVTWTGTGTNRPSIGHGLGVAPAMIIEKGRDAGSGPFSWTVQHIGLSSWSNSLFLNNTSAENSGSGGGTAPSSTVYYAAVNNYAGENGVRYVAYCFAPVAGYSAFGKYTGNGSTDGPFVYTGFRPRYVMVKNTVDPNNWTIFDTARNTYNIIDLQIYPTTDAEVAGGSSNGIDFLSNGFKLRSSFNWGNRAGDNIIYMAFAEHPFKNSLAR